MMIKMFILEKFGNTFWLEWDFWHVWLWSLAINSWNADMVEFIFVLNTTANVSSGPYGLDKYIASAYCISILAEG